MAWALATALACVAAGAWTRPVTGDNQVYFFVAERAASGVPPHLSLVDSKSQLSGLIAAAAMVVGREVGLDDVRSGRVASIALAAAAVALTAELGLLVTGAQAGAQLAALALLTSRGFVKHAAIGTNPKIFLITFVVLAHLLCVRRRWWAAGVAACAAFLCWQPGLAVVGAVAVEALAVAGGGPLAALANFAGALAVFAAYQLYYATYGVVAEQLRQCYVMTLGSVHGVRSLHRAASALWFVMSDAGRRHGSLWLAPVAWFTSMAVGTCALIARPSATMRWLRERPGRVSLVLASIVVTAFTLYDHQGLPDLFLPAPYFALATAWLVVSAADRATAVTGLPHLRAALAVLIAAVMVGQGMGGGIAERERSPSLDDQYRAGAATRRYVDGYSGVWVYRSVHLLGFAHADNWVPYALLYDDIETRFPIRGFRPLRDGRMPEVILAKKGHVPGGRGYLRKEYRELADPLLARENVTVYVRRPSE